MWIPPVTDTGTAPTHRHFWLNPKNLDVSPALGTAIHRAVTQHHPLLLLLRSSREGGEQGWAGLQSSEPWHLPVPR